MKEDGRALRTFVVSGIVVSIGWTLLGPSYRSAQAGLQGMEVLSFDVVDSLRRRCCFPTRKWQSAVLTSATNS